MSDLSIDDLIRIFVPVDNDSEPGQPESGHRLVAFVKEVRGDQLVLKLAASANGPAPIHSGIVIVIQKPLKSGVLMHRAVITAVGSETHPSIIVKTLAPGEQVQRRSFFRVPIDIRARYSRAGNVRNWFSATLRDLSEAGACFVAHERLEPGDRILLELPAVERAISINGVVRRCWTEKRLGNVFIVVGVAFLDNDDSCTDKVRRIVFQRQLRICRQEAG